MYKILLFFILQCMLAVISVHGFTIKSNSPLASRRNLISPFNNGSVSNIVLHASDDNTSSGEEVKKTLEEKMKGWEASEEEIRSASLGGITPGRSDGFDIGLFIAFPFIVGSALLFAVFPLIMDKIDVSSVGPPPMS